MSRLVFLVVTFGLFASPGFARVTPADIDACRCGNAEEAAICVGKQLLKAIHQSSPPVFDYVVGNTGYSFGSGSYNLARHREFCNESGLRMPSEVQLKSLFAEITESTFRQMTGNSSTNGQCVYASGGSYVCHPDYVSSGAYSDFSAVCVGSARN